VTTTNRQFPTPLGEIPLPDSEAWEQWKAVIHEVAAWCRTQPDNDFLHSLVVYYDSHNGYLSPKQVGAAMKTRFPRGFVAQ
jgi:hypothetical protein